MRNHNSDHNTVFNDYDGFPFEDPIPMTPENTPGVVFLDRTNLIRAKIAFALVAFENNVLAGHECSLVFKGTSVYLTSNDPHAVIASTNIMSQQNLRQSFRELADLTGKYYPEGGSRDVLR